MLHVLTLWTPVTQLAISFSCLTCSLREHLVINAPWICMISEREELYLNNFNLPKKFLEVLFIKKINTFRSDSSSYIFSTVVVSFTVETPMPTVSGTHWALNKYLLNKWNSYPLISEVCQKLLGIGYNESDDSSGQMKLSNLLWPQSHSTWSTLHFILLFHSSIAHKGGSEGNYKRIWFLNDLITRINVYSLTRGSLEKDNTNQNI